MAAQLQRIAAALARIGAAMNPCLTQHEIGQFERQHGIDLPDDYADFLRTIGNGGGPVPYYGLMPLGRAPERFPLADIEALTEIGKPFPFSEGWCWEDDEDGPVPDRHAGVHRGRLVLGHEGCGDYPILIVAGPQRGKVWHLADIGIFPMTQPRPSSTGTRPALQEQERGGVARPRRPSQ